MDVYVATVGDEYHTYETLGVGSTLEIAKAACNINRKKQSGHSIEWNREGNYGIGHVPFPGGMARDIYRIERVGWLG